MMRSLRAHSPNLARQLFFLLLKIARHPLNDRLPSLEIGSGTKRRRDTCISSTVSMNFCHVNKFKKKGSENDRLCFNSTSVNVSDVLDVTGDIIFRRSPGKGRGSADAARRGRHHQVGHGGHAGRRGGLQNVRPAPQQLLR